MYPKNYIPTSHGFNSTLTDLKTLCWTPPPFLESQDKIPPIIQCINYMYTGESKQQNPSPQKMEEMFGTWGNTSMNWEKFHNLCLILNIVIDIYHEFPVADGRIIDYKWSFGITKTDYERLAVVQSYRDYNYYMLLLPDKTGRLPILKKVFCLKCCVWRNNDDWINHKKDCVRCQCGRAYLKSKSTSHIDCTIPHYTIKSHHFKVFVDYF